MVSQITDRVPYQDSSGLAFKAPVRTVSGVPVVLSGLQTINGVALGEGDRILLLGQADNTTNGIYHASAGNWSRAGDMAGANNVACGTLVAVNSSVGAFYQLTSPDPVQIGSNPITFAPVPLGQLANPTIFQGQPGDIANVYYDRSAQYAGGNFGNTIACLRVQSDVGPNVVNFEWAFLSVLNNSATGGENVAIYGQGNRVTALTGPTWGGVMEVRELVAIADPQHGLIGLEVDNRSNGTDANFNRVGIDVVASKYNALGPPTTVSWGVRVQANNDPNVTIINGFAVWEAKVQVAFDCGNALGVTLAALRMPSGAPILFDTPGVNQLWFDGTGLRYQAGGNLQVRLNNDGSISYGGNTLPFQMLGTQAANATAGGGQAVPGTVLGYKVEKFMGTTIKVPYFAN